MELSKDFLPAFTKSAAHSFSSMTNSLEFAGAPAQQSQWHFVKTIFWSDEKYVPGIAPSLRDACSCPDASVSIGLYSAW